MHISPAGARKCRACGGRLIGGEEEEKEKEKEKPPVVLKKPEMEAVKKVKELMVDSADEAGEDDWMGETAKERRTRIQDRLEGKKECLAVMRKRGGTEKEIKELEKAIEGLQNEIDEGPGRSQQKLKECIERRKSD